MSLEQKINYQVNKILGVKKYIKRVCPYEPGKYTMSLAGLIDIRIKSVSHGYRLARPVKE